MFFIHTFSMIKVFKKREEVEQLWKIKVCERNKALGIQLDIDFMGTYKKTKTILSYFNDLSLSPIPLVSDCPFIPSLFTLIFDSDNTDAYEYLYYAKKHTRGKEYWSYEEYDK